MLLLLPFLVFHRELFLLSQLQYEYLLGRPRLFRNFKLSYTYAKCSELPFNNSTMAYSVLDSPGIAAAAAAVVSRSGSYNRLFAIIQGRNRSDTVSGTYTAPSQANPLLGAYFGLTKHSYCMSRK